MKIKSSFIPKGRRNRPGYAMEAEHIVIHDTGNRNSGADAKAHAAYLKGDHAASRPVSWHFTVDDKSVYQHLPLNESGWHSGDGTGPGNRRGIGIEICMNRDGDRAKAEKNAVWLCAKLIREQKSLKPFPECMTQHNTWSPSGKNCPQVLRGRTNGWRDFVSAVKAYDEPEAVEGELFRVQTGAFANRAYANKLEEKLKKSGFDTYMVQADNLYKVQVGAFSKRSNADNLSDRLQKMGFDTYITTKDGAPVKPESKIEVGKRVMVKQGAKTYTGSGLASFVYENIYTVMEVRGDRAVIGIGDTVITAIHADNLKLL